MRDYSKGGYSSDYQSYYNRRELERNERKKKQEQTTKAFASISNSMSKRTDALSSGNSISNYADSKKSNLDKAVGRAGTGNGTTRALAKMAAKTAANTKANPPDAKLKQSQIKDAKTLKRDTTKALKEIARTDPEKNTEALIKSGDYERMPKAKNMNTPSAENRAALRVTPQGLEKRMQDPAYKRLYSGSRGIMSGVTWGTSNRLLAGDKNDEYDREMERVYQENKSHGAELAGEFAGSFVSFGKGAGATKKLVGGATRKGVNTVLGERAFEKGVQTLTKNVAKDPFVRRAAKQELNLAIKKGLVNASDDVAKNEYIQRFAAKRAAKLVDALGAEVSLNLTGVALMDFNRASSMYETGSKEWWDEIKRSAKTNAALSAVILGVPALRVRGGIPFVGGVRKDTQELLANMAKNADTPEARQAMREAFVRDGEEAGRRLDLNELLAQNSPLRQADDVIRPQNLDEAVERAAVETVERNADDVARAVEPTERYQAVRDAERAQGLGTGRVAEPTAPVRTDKRQAEQLIGKDLEIFNKQKANFEKSMDELDIRSMEETLERIKQTHADADIPFDATELETTIARYKRVAEDLENGVEWRMGEKGWERKAVKGKAKGKWIKKDPLKTNPPKKPATEPPAPRMTPEEYTQLSNEADVKVRNIADTIADKSTPKAPKLNAEERIDNVANLRTEAEAAEDAGKYAGVERDVDFKGDTVDMGFSENGDDLARARNAVKEEVERTRGNVSEFDSIRDESYKNAGLDVKPEAKERMNVGEINEVRGNEIRNNYEHTEKGFGTVATGLGDVEFKGKVHDAIARGELNIDVYHNKENYEAAAGRLKAHLERNGNMDAWRDRFNSYAKRVLPLNTDEQRELIYDGLAAIDYANSLAKSESKAVRDEAGELFVSACKALSEQASVGGLTGNQFRLIAMSSPEYRARAMYETILGIFNRSKGMRKALGKGKGNPITLDELQEIINKNPALRDTLNALKELDSATSAEEVEKMASKAYLEARSVIPMTAFDQITQWRYVAMLSSPKTHIRNLTSNIYSATLGQGRDAIASAFEDTALKKAVASGKVAENDAMKSAGGLSLSANIDSRKGTSELFQLKRLNSKLAQAKYQLEHANPTDKAKLEKLSSRVKELEGQIGKAEKNIETKVASIERKTARKAQESWQTRGYDNLVTDAEKFERRVYGGTSKRAIFKLNDKASAFIGKALETSDALSLERIYREKYDKILMANGWETLSEAAAKGDLKASARLTKLEEYAAQEAAYTAARDTYRSYSKLSSALNKFVSDSLFNYDAPLWKKGAGLLTHALVPFTKVPVNLVKRGLNYSPIGLIEAKTSLTKAIEAGDVVEINRACERLAEGTIGTGIAALGAGLGFADPDGMMITGRLNKHDFLDKKKRDAGFQNYSVNANNMSFTLDWASPTAATLFTGVEFGRMLRNALDKSAEEGGLQFDFWKAFDVPLVLVSSLIEPTLQLGVFQGINDALEKTVEADNYSETDIHPALTMVGNIMTSYARSQLTPALMGSLARAVSPYDYYVPYGATTLESEWNQIRAKVPFLANEWYGANTNVWGDIKGEKTSKGDYAKSFAVNLFSPANVKKITWDDTDEFAADYYKKTGYEGSFPQNYRKDEIAVGRIKDAHNIKMSNKDIAEYNVARGKSGADAMDALLNDTVLFTRYSKDEKGKYTVADPNNIPDDEKARLIKEAENWTLKDVVNWMSKRPEFQNATEKEQQRAFERVYGESTNPFGGDDDQVYGSTRAAQRHIAMKNGMSADEYDYYNEVPARVQENLKSAIDAGVITAAQALDYARNGGKVYYKTDESGESGGTVETYYNKAEGLEYLEQMGYSHDEAEALYNGFKKSDAKDYDYAASHSGKSGKGRRRRGYRRRGYRSYGGSSAKATVPKPKAIKANSFAKGEALVSSTSKSSSAKKTNKVTPPQLKRVQAKIDLPTKR